jgi:transcriptional regulator with GAF, ATPase, and Fis domain/tetratricopeptide (TPR) repeat protein
MQLAPRTVIHEKYKVIRPLGQGGMATTYLVTDIPWQRQVALKVIEAPAPALAAAFRQEFFLLTRSHHPSLTRVHDFGSLQVQGGAACFYTADYIEGGDLAEHARTRAWSDLVGPVGDLLAALAFLHRAGIRHGDVKPANVLVGSDGRGVLIDLGCARPISAPPDGTVSGTAELLAPEVIEGAAADHRADLYALGVTLRTITSGLASPPPPHVIRLIDRLVQPRPGLRPADVGEVQELLGLDRSIPAVPVSAPLLGRGPVMEQLEAAIEALHEGRDGHRVVCLSGPPGVGRTRVMHELKWTCQLRGDVLEGSATEPLAVTALLRRAVGRPELAPTLDGVLEAGGSLLGRGDPLVIVLDDAHQLAPDQGALLDALARSIEPAGPVLLATSTIETEGASVPGALDVELQPLGEDDVARWVAPVVSPRSLAAVMAATGGYPARIERLLRDIAAGEVSETDLGAASGDGGDLRDLHSRRLGVLSPEERRGLAALCLAGGFADWAVLAALSVTPAVEHGLGHAGWTVPDPGGLRLARAGEADTLLESFDEGLRRELTSALAPAIRERIESLPEAAARAELGARLVRLLARAGDHDQAQREVDRWRDGFELAPREWTSALEAVTAQSRDPGLMLSRARMVRELGDPDVALRLLQRVVEPGAGPLGADEAWLARVETARCHLKLGDPDRCLALVREVVEPEPTGARRAELADLEARALIQHGAYAEARASAERAILGVADGSDELRAALHEDIGVAATYLGEPDLARDHLAEALRLRPGAGPRDRVRLHSYGAIAEYRLGNTAGAAEAYERAFALAERHGLSDLVATTALNLGTACHQRGDWGRALECYQRGLRTAVALGSRTTAVVLRFDLAQLHADIGAFDRASSMLDRVEELVATEGPRSLAGAVASLRAEVVLQLVGSSGPAAAELERALAEFESQGARREVAEVELQRARVASIDGDDVGAGRALTRAEGVARELDAPDLRARVALGRAALLVRRGRGDEAMRTLDAARELARQADQRLLAAEVENALAEAARSQGSKVLGRRHSELAIEHFERIAASLPAPLRDAFWEHPLRRRARRDPEADAGPTSAKLLRLLEINRKLSSSLKTDEVLQLAMDAAIELTGAERGFLVLEAPTGGRELTVPIARNLDREKIGRSQHKYSHTIARRVIATGEPVLTVDATQDERFMQQASVHAMRLRSVVSVPVRSPHGVLGALYLDNRFQHGRFREEDLGLLMAFADQVAIALVNARLVADLEERTRQLEAERSRIEAMVRSQAVEIDRLTEDLRARPTATLRHDYGRIVGRSAAVSDVLSLVDRVTESPFPVLIQGESGTGKELIARAIHDNGPRARRPFVTVNCAALPETLLESELFGHVRGAFTGAVRDRAGLFAEAQGGSIFLDEIGEMPAGMQAKLLRTLQDGEVRPLGSEAVIAVDARLLAATNRDLKREVATGRFREDLYYRVAVVEISLPPLRERVEDIPLLARHLLEELAREMGRAVPEVSERAMRGLARYGWPGNVRQLRNVLSRALVLAEGDTLTEHDVELPRDEPRRAAVRTRSQFECDEGAAIAAALERHRWNVSEVCRDLGIPRTTLYRKLRKHGLAQPR